MKKVLIGLAAGALAFTATASSVNAGAADGTSVYDILTSSSAPWSSDTDPDAGGPLVADGFTLGEIAKILVDAAGLDEALDECGPTGNNNGNPNYTVFFPASDLIFSAVLAGADLSIGQAAAQPALVKTLLLYHVVPSNIAPVQLADAQNTVFDTMGGLTLVKTDTNGATAEGYAVNGYPIVSVAGGTQACNGWVYLIGGFLAPNSAIKTVGTTSDGSTTQSAVDTDGDGLPKTGSESLALTYAALASLIAGAGVLVIRRRSVA